MDSIGQESQIKTYLAVIETETENRQYTVINEQQLDYQ